jgi:hypothetical protein
VTPKQRELVSSYLADISKGVVIASVIGWSTGAIRWPWFLGDLAVAIGLFVVALRFRSGEGDD